MLVYIDLIFVYLFFANSFFIQKSFLIIYSPSTSKNYESSKWKPSEQFKIFFI